MDPSRKLELLSVALGEIVWNSRNEYLELVLEFFYYQIDADEFQNRYRFLTSKHEKQAAALKVYLLENSFDFERNLEANDFGYLIRRIFYLFEFYDPDEKEYVLNKYRISEKGLRDYIANCYLSELEKCIKEQELKYGSEIRNYEKMLKVYLNFSPDILAEKRVINVKKLKDRLNLNQTTRIYNEIEVLQFVIVFFSFLTAMVYSLLNSNISHSIFQSFSF